MINPSKIKKVYLESAEENEKFRIYLKKNAVDYELDAHFLRLHNELFSAYDCRECSNCCKLYDILINKNDIAVISKNLELSENDFIEKYLAEYDEDYKIRDKPCCFLDTDGSCRIYEIRPAVCRDFPYTNQPYRLYNMYGLLSFSEECPVVFEIIKRLKQIYNYKQKN